MKVSAPKGYHRMKSGKSFKLSLYPTSFGDIVRGLHVYGAKVLRPEALVSAFYSID